MHVVSLYPSSTEHMVAHMCITIFTIMHIWFDYEWPNSLRKVVLIEGQARSLFQLRSQIFEPSTYANQILHDDQRRWGVFYWVHNAAARAKDFDRDADAQSVSSNYPCSFYDWFKWVSFIHWRTCSDFLDMLRCLMHCRRPTRITDITVARKTF